MLTTVLMLLKKRILKKIYESYSMRINFLYINFILVLRKLILFLEDRILIFRDAICN